MSFVNTLIIAAIAVWALQILLGWFQIVRFNRAFDQLAQKGRVGVGKNSGRFQPKVIIALAFNEQLEVIDGFIMRGYTIFASPTPFTQLCGLHLDEIQPEKVFPQDKLGQNALAIAISPKK